MKTVFIHRLSSIVHRLLLLHGFDRALEWNLFKVRHAFEGAEAFIDLFVRQTLHALGAELFDIERSHDRAEDHRAPQRRFVTRLLTVEITHEAARERVARKSVV